MKTALPITIGLLLISLAGNWYFWSLNRDSQNARMTDNSKSQQVIASKQAEFIKSDSLVKAIRTKVGKDSLETSRVVGALKGRVSGLRQKLAELGQITPREVEDTTCARLIQVSQLKDSVIIQQDSLITTLELRNSAHIIDLESIIREKSRQAQNQVAITEEYQTLLTNSQAEVRKEKKKVRLFKIIGGVLAAGIIYQSVK